jgi:hypothetical protein
LDLGLDAGTLLPSARSHHRRDVVLLERTRSALYRASALLAMTRMKPMTASDTTTVLRLSTM